MNTARDNATDVEIGISAILYSQGIDTSIVGTGGNCTAVHIDASPWEICIHDMQKTSGDDALYVSLMSEAGHEIDCLILGYTELDKLIRTVRRWQSDHDTGRRALIDQCQIIDPNGSYRDGDHDADPLTVDELRSILADLEQG